MNSSELGKISQLKGANIEESDLNFLICSENNFMAADHLRAAMLDLSAAYELLEQLLTLAKHESATSTKEASS